MLHVNEMYHYSHVQVKDEDDDVDWGEDVSDAAVQARRMQELTGAVSSMVVTDDLEKTPTERVNIFYNYVKVCCSSISEVLLFPLEKAT